MPRIAFACLLAAVLPVCVHAQTGTVDDFGFMAGEWSTTTPNGAHMEMRVLAPRAGTVAGFMRLSKDEDFWIQEYFVITAEAGELQMRIQPFDRLLTPSKLIVLRFRRWDGERAVFENTESNYPKWAYITRHADGSWTSRSEIINDDGSTHVIENTLRRDR